MQNRNGSKQEQGDDVKWISPADAARRLGVSRSQISRLAARHAWKRLDVSSSPQAANAGVRYALSAIIEFEKSHSY
jgi:hypothetical protein